MTQYNDIVEKRRIYLASEEWGNGVKMHYVCSETNDSHEYGNGYFIYYNNGRVEKIHGTKITIVQKANSIEQVMDDYEVAHAGQ